MQRIFESFTEAVGWLRIVASPTLIGLGIGALIYFSNPSITGLVIGIFFAAVGLIIGILLATKIWKKTGTIQFLSRISATPELDEKPKEDDKNSPDEKT